MAKELKKWSKTNDYVSKVFISYSHSDFGPYLDFLTDKLDERNISYWLDLESLHLGDDWEDEIEKGIKECDYFLFFMSKNSIRRPDGYCIKEISYAQSLNKTILPIRVEDVPKLIAFITIQYVDLYGLLENGLVTNEDKFNSMMEVICDICSNKSPILTDDGYKKIVKYLNPKMNYLSFLYDNFVTKVYGFNAIEERLNKWIDCDISQAFYKENDKEYSNSIIAIISEGGCGKTTFISKYAMKREDIVYVQFCRKNNDDSGDPKQVLMNMSFALSQTNSEYRAYLVSEANIENISEMSVEKTFETLFASPFNKYQLYNRNFLFIIDGLDEISNVDNFNLLPFLRENFENTRLGIRFIVTTRKTNDIQKQLGDTRYTAIMQLELSATDIGEGIKEFLNDELPKLSHKLEEGLTIDKVRKTIIEKSDNNFLYAKTVINEIKNEDAITLARISRLPQGINQMYLEYFKSKFSNNSIISYDEVKQLLMILIAKHESLTIKEIIKMLENDEKSIIINNMLKPLGDHICKTRINDAVAKQKYEYFFGKKTYDLSDEDLTIIEILHMCLKDWICCSEANEFIIKKTDAHRLIAKYYTKNKNTIYYYKYYLSHLIQAGSIDEAEILLCDMSFYKKKEKMLGATECIRTYFNDIIEFAGNYSSYEDSLREIYNSEPFKYCMSTYGNFLYNEEKTYKRLEETGFSKYAINMIKELVNMTLTKENYQFYVSCVEYLYIVGNHKLVISAVNKIFSLNEEDIPNDSIIELYNLYALSSRKLGKINDCIKFSEKSIELNEKTHANDYRAAVSKLTLGKIYYYSLDFIKGQNVISEGIELLKKCLRNYDTDDEEDDELDFEFEFDSKDFYAKDYNDFITFYNAAFYREIALCQIWNHQLIDAKKNIDIIKNIYQMETYTIDRYYCRYNYLKMFYLICSNKCDEAEELFDTARKYSNSKYTIVKSYFFGALCAYKANNLDLARQRINNALEKAKKESSLDLCETYVLEYIINGKIKNLSDYDFIVIYDTFLDKQKEAYNSLEQKEKEYVEKWGKYVTKFILEL